MNDHRIAVLANRDKCSTQDIRDVLNVVQKHSNRISVMEFHREPLLHADILNSDLVVVLGGDGTIIGICHKFGKQQKPIIGINFGKLGYLANFSLSEFIEYANKGLIEHKISSRIILRARIYKSDTGDLLSDEFAVNDCVIDIGPPFRMTSLDVTINNRPLSLIDGDGVIVSSPTGSTAYNMSAGGPIVEPTVSAFIVTPKNPHKLSIRPIVVPSEHEIVIGFAGSRRATGVYLIIDGQIQIPMIDEMVMKISRFESDLRLVENPLSGYYKTLNTKLKWGA